MENAQSERYCIRPGCGSPNLTRHSFSEEGKQRWHCQDCGKRSVNFLTEPPEPTLDTSEYHAYLTKRIEKAISTKQPLTLVVTAAQNATPPFERFKRNLEALKKHRQGELIVHPYRYHNPTSIWSEKDQSQDWWHLSLHPYLLNQNLEINKNLVLMAEVMVQPTATRPLQGLETMSADKSAVLGHPKLELLSIPTPQSKMPKLLTTTGAITKKNYTQSKAGKKGEFHHTFGAIIIELRDGFFHIRQINATKNGDFTDLTERFENGEVKQAPRAAALIMGDTHYEFMAPNVLRATFTDKNSMVNVLKPRHLVWHDSWDGYAMSHHHRGNPHIKFAKVQAKRNNVQQSLDQFFSFVDDVTPPDTQNIFVASNHPEFLDRWLRETSPHDDATNAIFWHKASLAVYEGIQATPQGTFVPSAFSWYGKQRLKCWKRTRFLARGESFMVHNVELGYHGDKGAHGKPGTVNQYTKVGVKSVVGHHHSVSIMDGVYCVGLSAYTDMDYTLGQLNAALQAHCVLYANGKRSLLIILPNGSW